MNRGEAGGLLALPADAIVLSANDAADLTDYVYQVRCAAEVVATALDEGAGATELRELCDALIQATRSDVRVPNRVFARRLASRHPSFYL